MARSHGRGPALPVEPSRKAEERQTTKLIASALLILLCLYLAFPDKIYVFDGVMFSFVIERHVPNLALALLNRRHLLFMPVMLGLRDLLVAAGHPVAGYELVQKVNAVLGTLGVWLYYRLLLRLTRDAAVSGVCAVCLGLSYVFWGRAAEGQVYLIMTVGALATGWAALEVVEDPRPRRVAGLSAIFAAAVLFHAANAALLPLAAAALWFAAPQGRRAAFFGALLAACLGIAAVYAAAFHIRGPASLLSFLLAATEFRATPGTGSWGSLLWDFFFRGGLRPWSRVETALQQLSGSLVFSPAQGLGAALAGAGLLAALAAAAKASWPRLEADQRRAAALLALLGSSFALLDCFWGGGVFLWGPPAFAFLALAGLFWAKLLAGAAGASRNRQLGLGLCLALAMGGWNLKTGISPQGRIENNSGYRQALFVKAHTVPTSWVVTSGFGFPNSKVYLTQFSKRSNWALEYFLRAAPKPQALANFHAFLQDVMRHGLPVYALSDLLDDKAVQDSFRALWGVEPQEVRDCFGPGRFLSVAEYGHGLRVYFFLPDEHREELFAGLAFNLLDTSDPVLAQEARGFLAQIGAALTPQGRRRAAAVLEGSRYGAQLAFSGMEPYLDENTKLYARQYAERFMRSPGPRDREALSAIHAILGAAKKPSI
ncbi:MAG: hypothetical protein NTY77_10215 [Elusimicrobia bacterium]|nr:hypothetical protein [Elusimicrobiota bacterium]